MTVRELIEKLEAFYQPDDGNHATFSTIEAMEECLKSMREISKVPPTYLNRICKKENVEILDL